MGTARHAERPTITKQMVLQVGIHHPLITAFKDCPLSLWNILARWSRVPHPRFQVL